MNIKRYFGKNSREALSMVRQELGADAVILSNRAVDGGNEILAFREQDMANLVASNKPVGPVAPAFIQQPAEVQDSPVEETLVAMLNRNQRILRPAEPLNQQQLQVHRTQAKRQSRPDVAELSMPKPSQVPAARTKPQARAQTKPSLAEEAQQAALAHKVQQAQKAQLAAEQAQKAQLAQKAQQAQLAQQAQQAKQVQKLQEMQQEQHRLAQLEMANMMQELRAMRGNIENQLTEMSWSNIQQRDPVKSAILRAMLAAGFSAGLSRQIAEKTPADRTEADAMKWLHNVLGNNLQTISDEQQILDQGGIFALVGPTGVGKTTTTAKLAARFVMKHGAGKLALISTDSYRIGGHEQLRIYGKILGVMVHAVKDEADLRIALNELKGKHTILIDTVGVSQRDQMVSEQIAMLSNTGMPIKKLLCMNATSTGETLADVIDAYKRRGLDGCIITKLDEAAAIGSVLDVIIRERLRVYYVANGQRVPEDIHIANKQFLVHQALKMAQKKNEHFQFRDEEMPFLMANAGLNPAAGMLLDEPAQRSGARA